LSYSVLIKFEADISKSALNNTENGRLAPPERSRSSKDASVASIDLSTSESPLAQPSQALPQVSMGLVPIPAQQDPSAMSQKGAREMAKALVCPMRNWQGDIRLEARFGRILIRNPHKRFFESYFSFEEETVIQHLHENSPYQPTTDFTRILTTFPAEAQYLIHLKEENGYPMWRPTASRSVKYELDWTDQDTNDSYLLEINAETFTSRVKFNPWETEQVLVHCPLRLWDFAINASKLRNADQDETGLWREICDSLYIP
jgi:hypothetical protein